MKKCLLILFIVASITGCQKPQPIPTPVPATLPVIEEPKYRTEELAKRPGTPTVEELIVALTLDLLETKATLRKALTVMSSMWPPPKKPDPPKAEK